MNLVRCIADKYGEGYESISLRQDAAEAYNAVRKIVTEKGGILTSSGTMRELNADVSEGRSPKSFHYIGLALDLYIYSGMQNTRKDPYIIQLESLEDRRFKVYVRCDPSRVEQITVSDVVTDGDRCARDHREVTGPFISLTELFINNGFQPVRARAYFFDRQDGYLGAEWWHFQYERALIPNVSTFGDELLKIYSLREVENTPPWEYKKCVFKVDWF